MDKTIGYASDLSSQYSKYAEGYDVANDSKNNTYITGYNEHNNSYG